MELRKDSKFMQGRESSNFIKASIRSFEGQLKTNKCEQNRWEWNIKIHQLWHDSGEMLARWRLCAI